MKKTNLLILATTLFCGAVAGQNSDEAINFLVPVSPNAASSMKKKSKKLSLLLVYLKIPFIFVALFDKKIWNSRFVVVSTRGSYVYCILPLVISLVFIFRYLSDNK